MAEKKHTEDKRRYRNVGGPVAFGSNSLNYFGQVVELTDAEVQDLVRGGGCVVPDALFQKAFPGDTATPFASHATHAGAGQEFQLKKGRLADAVVRWRQKIREARTQRSEKLNKQYQQSQQQAGRDASKAATASAEQVQKTVDAAFQGAKFPGAEVTHA